VARIELEGVGRSFTSGGKLLTVLDGVDLVIEAGELVAVTGPSGSGKSTLLGLVAGLDRPSRGVIRIDGREIQDLDEDQLALLRRGRIGFVFQSFQLLENLTAAENVRLPLGLAGRTDLDERTRELLDRVGLAERGHHYPRQLSGGEQQRVALARAFAVRPAVLLADEPTGNLDPATGAQVLDLLTELHAAEGTTLVLVTHDAEVARRASRTIGLVAGRITSDERLRPSA